MRGFHVNWTRPFAVRAPGMPYAVEPFEREKADFPG